jgi:hypothetical protein
LPTLACGATPVSLPVSVHLYFLLVLLWLILVLLW